MSPQDNEYNGNILEQNPKVNNNKCSGLSHHVLCEIYNISCSIIVFTLVLSIVKFYVCYMI